MNIKNVVALEEVKDDIDIGESFYDSQELGIGEYFRMSIVSDIESLRLYGGVHSKIFGFYRMLSKRFPFAIYYDIQNETVIVMAVLDMRQNPSNTFRLLHYRQK